MGLSDERGGHAVRLRSSGKLGYPATDFALRQLPGCRKTYLRMPDPTRTISQDAVQERLLISKTKMFSGVRFDTYIQGL